MKKQYFIILIVFLPTLSFGQGLSDSLVATFYNQTLTSYYSDTIAISDQEKFGCILYETDIDSNKLIKTAGVNKFKFFNSKTNKHLILDKPYKINKDRSIYSISYKQIAQDTVDINIGKWTVVNCDKKHIYLGGECDGGMGNIPNARFIFIKSTNNWLFTTPRQTYIRQLLDKQKRINSK